MHNNSDYSATFVPQGLLPIFKLTSREKLGLQNSWIQINADTMVVLTYFLQC